MRSALISPEDLAAQLGNPTWKILDTTYYLGKSSDIAKANYKLARIPQAVFFDIDAIADTKTDLPHMLPTDLAFAEAMGQLGLQAEDTIVVYDAQGLFSAPRVWWMLRHFGHEKVWVLNGGLPAWQAAGYSVESGVPPIITPCDYHMAQNAVKQDVIDWTQIVEHLNAPQFKTIIDARAKGRFDGITDEPRPGLQKGHIPGSMNVPWNSLVDPETKMLLPGDQLQQSFEAAGLSFPVSLEGAVVCSCGSGMTACILALALYELEVEHTAIYDGSWAEWGAREALPIITCSPK